MKLVIKDFKLGTQRTRTKKLYLNFFLILIVRTRFVADRNSVGFARKKGPNNIICRAWV